MSVDIDDTDSTIMYSGSWSALTGSSRQFDSTVHSTTQTGASATIKFHGTRIMVYQTVPMGDTTETTNSNFDGNMGSISRHSHPSVAYYEDLWFDSGPVTLGDHTLIVSNGGGPSDTPFLLDRFVIEGNVIPPASIPGPASPSASDSVPITIITTAVSTTTASFSSSAASLSRSSSSSASTSTSSNTTIASSSTVNQTSAGEKTVTAIQYITTSASESISTSASTSYGSASASFKAPIGRIVGAVLGSLALILVLLLAFCIARRRRKQQRSANSRRSRRTTDVTPYDLGTNLSRHSLMRNESQGSRNQQPSTSERNQEFMAEKNHDLFSDSTSPVSDIYATASSVIESTSPSSRTHDTLPRMRYLSGDTLLVGPSNHPFGVNPLGPIDSADIPPSYQSLRSRNSNLPPPHS